jgi:hypothetical protein
MRGKQTGTENWDRRHGGASSGRLIRLTLTVLGVLGTLALIAHRIRTGAW